MSEGRLIARNVSVLTLAQGVSMLAGMGTTMILARALGPESFGILGFGMAIITYFQMAATFGSDTYGAREIARRREEAGAIVGLILGPRFVMAGLGYVGLIGVAVLIVPDPTTRAVVLIQGGMLLSTALMLDYAFQGAERMELNALRQSSQSLLVFVGVALMVRGKEDVILAASLQVGVALLVALLSHAYGRRLFGGVRLVVGWVAWKTLILRSAPFALIVLMGTIYNTVDIIMLEYMTDKTQVGQYVAAYRVVLLSLVPEGIIFAAFYPALAKVAGDSQNMRAWARRLAAILMLTGMPIAVFGAVFPDAILGFLFGEAFLPASGTLRLLMLNVGVLYLRIAFDAPLTAWNRERRHAAVMVMSALLNVGLNLWLIPEHGMEGAALASLISQLAALLLFAVVHYRAAGGAPGLILLKGLTAAAPALAVGAVVGQAMEERGEVAVLLAGGTVVVGVFFLGAFVLRLLVWDELTKIFNR